MSSPRSIPWASVIGHVAKRPDLWPTAFGVGRRFAPQHWWRRPPFMPLPSPNYLRFRLQTQYGDAELAERPVGSDVIDYLEWCRAWRRQR